jgi:hypothetical protein
VLFRYDASEKRFVAIDANGPIVAELAFAETAPVAACVVSGRGLPNRYKRSTSARARRASSRHRRLRLSPRCGAARSFRFL